LERQNVFKVKKRGIVISKVLITGVAGFIGSNLSHSLSDNHDIFIVDDLSMGKKRNIPQKSNVYFYQNSVTNIEFMRKLLTVENFDYIFHLAAIASVADSIRRPVCSNNVNFKSTLDLLDILKKMESSNLKKFVFSSSAAIYGDSLEIPKYENSEINPKSPYAIDKYAAERYTLLYNNLYGLPTTAVRFFNVFGPRQNPDSPYSGVISIILNQFINQINNNNGEFNLYGDGKQTRDYIYIDDVIEILEMIAISEKSVGNVYNVGLGVETELNELLDYISEKLSTQIKVNYLPARQADIKKSVASIKKIEELGFTPKFSVKDGLNDYIEKLMIK